MSSSDDLSRLRSQAQAALVGAALGLAVVASSEDGTMQVIAAGWAIICTIAQRAIWRCPRCGIPPSGLPWGPRSQACLRCAEDADRD